MLEEQLVFSFFRLQVLPQVPLCREVCLMLVAPSREAEGSVDTTLARARVWKGAQEESLSSYVPSFRTASAAGLSCLFVGLLFEL